eukprot:6835146-Prymnesium_polylepis.1
MAPAARARPGSGMTRAPDAPTRSRPPPWGPGIISPDRTTHVRAVTRGGHRRLGSQHNDPLYKERFAQDRAAYVTYFKTLGKTQAMSHMDEAGEAATMGGAEAAGSAITQPGDPSPTRGSSQGIQPGDPARGSEGSSRGIQPGDPGEDEGGGGEDAADGADAMHVDGEGASV